MNDEPNIPEQPEPSAPQAREEPAAPTIAHDWYAQQEQLAAFYAERRRQMVRRLGLVLAGSLAAFCVIVFALVRSDSALLDWLGVAGPSRVVRQHLDALSRGEAREAYAYFSENYRGQIPLRAYEQLVKSHRSMFRTHVVSIATPQRSSASAVLDTRLAASSGTLYRARFSLVRVDGRWYIDEVRWSEAPSASSFTRT